MLFFELKLIEVKFFFSFLMSILNGENLSKLKLVAMSFLKKKKLIKIELFERMDLFYYSSLAL